MQGKGGKFGFVICLFLVSLKRNNRDYLLLNKIRHALSFDNVEVPIPAFMSNNYSIAFSLGYKINVLEVSRWFKMQLLTF